MKYKYIYIITDDYYYFQDALRKVGTQISVTFCGNMTVTNLATSTSCSLNNYIADKRRLYKIKELK